MSNKEIPVVEHNNICPYHEDNTQLLGRHSGYWKISILFIGIFLTAMITFARWQVTQTTAMREVIVSLDKNISLYTTISTEKLAAYDARLTHAEHDIQNLYKRLNKIAEHEAIETIE